MEDRFKSIRKKAEHVLKEKGMQDSITYSKNLEELIEELNIYHIELEHQNDELRQTQEELTRSQLKYKDLFENAPNAYLNITIDKKILDCNNTFTTLIGYEKKYILEKTFTDFISPHSQDIFYFFFNKVIDTYNQHECILQITRRDQSFIHAKVEARKVKNNGEEHIRVSLNDITRIKTMEDMLQKEKERWERSFEMIQEGMFLMDEDYTIIRCNKAFEELVELKKEEIIRKKSFEILNLEASEKETLHALKNRSGSQDGEYLLKGTRKYVSIKTSPIYDKNGKFEFTVVTVSDISNRKQKEEYKEQLSSIVENSGDAIVGLDLKGDITSWNRGATLIYGYSKEEMLGKNIKILLPDDRKNETEDYIHQLIKGSEKHTLETKRITKDNRLIDISLSISYLKNEAGSISGISTIARDITEIKYAQNALKESEERYRLLMEFAGVGIGYYDEWGNVIMYNERASRYVNKSKKELVGKNIKDLFGEEAAKIYLDRIKKALRQNKTLNFEDSVSLNNKDYFFISNYTPVKNGNGKPIGVQIISNDVSDLKRTEKELIEREKLLSHAQQIAALGIWDWNLQTNEAFWSDELYKIYGRKPSEGPPPMDSYMTNIHPEDRDYLQKRIDKVLKGKTKNYQAEYRIYRYNDKAVRHLHAEAEVLFDQSGKPVRLMGVVKDETERVIHEQNLKKAIGDLEKSEEKLSELLRETNRQKEEIEGLLQGAKCVLQIENFEESAIKLYHRCKEVIGAKAGYVALLSSTGEENEVMYLDPGVYKCTVDPELPMPIRGLREIAYETGEVVYDNHFDESGWKRFMPKGHVTLNSVMFAPLKINNKAVGLMGLSNKEGGFSIHDSKIAGAFGELLSIALLNQKHRESLVEAKEKAEESDRLKSAFLANMSHEIRTPMNGILGFAGLLKNKNVTQQKREQYVEIIDNRCKDLLHIIDDILDISKLEVGQLQIIQNDFNLHKLLAESFLLFNEKLKTLHKEHITLESSNDIFGRPLWMSGDDVRVKQILYNLLDNALKFIHQGKVVFGYTIDQGKITFFVKDTGIGIPKEKQEIIFERFRQTESANNRQYGGNGLGLSICKSLATLMDGKIWVESKSGKGSVFYFEIPFNEAKDKKHRTIKPKTKEEHLKKAKILVVEDDHYSRIYFEEILEELDISYDFAKNGKQAIEYFKKKDFCDLVFLDIELPDINGLEVAKAIKAINKKITVVAQTAHAMENDRKKCMLAGCDDFITKPLNHDMLKKIISKSVKEKVYESKTNK